MPRPLSEEQGLVQPDSGHLADPVGVVNQYRLVERGELVEVTGRQRGRIYEAPRIFEAVYGPVPVEEQEAGELPLHIGPGV